jgi:hypothetical protein
MHILTLNLTSKSEGDSLVAIGHRYSQSLKNSKISGDHNIVRH